MMFQGAIAKFDPKTEKFQFYPMPKEQNDNVTQLNMLGLQYQRRRQDLDQQCRQPGNLPHRSRLRQIRDVRIR